MSDSTQQPELLTPGDVCRIAQVSRDTVARWARDGILPVAQQLPGGQRRFRREDVEALLTPTPAPEPESAAS